MTFDEWFKITMKFDFDIVHNDIAPRDRMGIENLKKWVKLIYNAGWNDGKDSKATEQILSSLKEKYES